MFFLMIIPALILAFFKKMLSPRVKRTLLEKHVVITGGSSGIGKSVAIEAAKQGANVTIMARNLEKLQEALKEIKENCTSETQIVKCLSVDVSNLDLVRKSLLSLEEEVAPVYMLVNCAGMAICGEVENLTPDQVKTLYEVNYLGTLYPIQTLVPGFKARKDGIIVLTGSQAGLMGLYGMSVYSSFKFALRGLAESISMELSPYKVSVTLALPPDTDTPGYELENREKPQETKLISGSAGLVQPEVVARKLLEDALLGNFFSYVGFESGLLTTLSVGMTPFTSLFELLWQSIALGPIRLISGYYVDSFYKIVEKCYKAKIKEQ